MVSPKFYNPFRPVLRSLLHRFPIPDWPNPQLPIPPRIHRWVEMRPCNSAKKHYLCDVRFVFNTMLWVLLIQDKEVTLLFSGKEELFLIQMNTITHVLILRGVLWIAEMVSHQQPPQHILLCQNRFQ